MRKLSSAYFNLKANKSPTPNPISLPLEQFAIHYRNGLDHNKLRLSINGNNEYFV